MFLIIIFILYSVPAGVFCSNEALFAFSTHVLALKKSYANGAMSAYWSLKWVSILGKIHNLILKIQHKNIAHFKMISCIATWIKSRELPAVCLSPTTSQIINSTGLIQNINNYVVDSAHTHEDIEFKLCCWTAKLHLFRKLENYPGWGGHIIISLFEFIAKTFTVNF